MKCVKINAEPTPYRCVDMLANRFCRRHSHVDVRKYFLSGAVLRWGRGARAPPPDSLVPPPPQIQKLADRSDVISEFPKCSKSTFSGAPRSLGPLADGEGARCPPLKNPTRALGRGFYGSQGLTHYRLGNPINDRFQM